MVGIKSDYESNYYRYIWSTNNHIPAIGEGLSVVDFTGAALVNAANGPGRRGVARGYVLGSLAHVADIAAHGASYQRQRHAYRETRDLREVVRSVVTELS